VVDNLELMIRLGVRSAELSGAKARANKPSFVRVHGVLTLVEVDELKAKFTTTALSSGEGNSLSKKGFKRLIALCCRDNGEKVGFSYLRLIS